MKCLLVQTADRRRFLTSVRNLGALAEFCRNFGARALVVDVRGRQKLLSLEELANSVCDPYKAAPEFEYTVLNSTPLGSRSEKAAKNKRLIAILQHQLSSGRTVCVNRFAIRHGVPAATARSCLKRAASSLASGGRTLLKTGPGEYRLS